MIYGTRLALLFLFMCPLVSPAQENNPLHQDLIKSLDSLTDLYCAPNTPGVATAIVENGKLVYTRCTGLADLADSSAITPHTRFNIASNAKQFTALAILHLQQAGKLSLTQDIRDFIPGLLSGINEKISIRHLITHTSGIRDIYDLINLGGMTWWRTDSSNQDVLNVLMRQQDVNFKPGSRYMYSNSNYILLAQIAEKITGESFIDYTRKIFDHFGLTETAFCDDPKLLRGPLAKPYFNFNTWTTFDWKWKTYGDGNFFTSLHDQIQWEQVLVDSMNTPLIRAFLTFPQENNPGSYAYGWERSSYKGKPIVMHEGATGAFKAVFIRFPETKVSFITLTNSGRITPYRQTCDMADMYFGLDKNGGSYLIRPGKTGKPVTEEEILGVYTNGDRFYFNFVKKEGQLYLVRDGRNDILLERENANVFHQAYDTAFKQEFNRNSKGEWQVTAYYTSHSPYTLVKEKQRPKQSSLKAWAGTYTNRELNIDLVIAKDSSGKWTLTLPRNSWKDPLLIDAQKLLIGSYKLIFKKRRAAKSEILLSGDRVANIRFLRRP